MPEQLFYLGVKALILNPQNCVLLLRRSTEKGHTNYWDLPGGRLDKTEAPLQALRREVHEETNMKQFDIVKCLHTFVTPLMLNQNGLILQVYLCTTPDTYPIQLSPEHSHYQWCTIQEAQNHLEMTYPPEVFSSMT